jgi:phosphopantetheine adenylyltransferase
MAEKQTYTKEIIEIADTLFANPAKDVSDIVSVIVSKCQKSERTVWRWVKKANAYNKERIAKQEKAKNEVLVSKAKEAAKKAILSRDESLEILSEIARGNARQVKKIEQVLIPSDSERTRAITVLADMQGWSAPKKSEITGNITFEKYLIETGVIEDTDE